MAIGAVLFDVDETLFDRQQAQRLVLERLPAALPALFGEVDFDTLWAAWQQSDQETTDHKYTVTDILTSRNVRSAAFLRILGLEFDLNFSLAQIVRGAASFSEKGIGFLAAQIEHR